MSLKASGKDSIFISTIGILFYYQLISKSSKVTLNFARVYIMTQPQDRRCRHRNIWYNIILCYIYICVGVTFFGIYLPIKTFSHCETSGNLKFGLNHNCQFFGTWAQKVAIYFFFIFQKLHVKAPKNFLSWEVQ